MASRDKSCDAQKLTCRYFITRLLAGCWSLVGSLDAISLYITEFIGLGITAAMS